jgi:hypothetical protein
MSQSIQSGGILKSPSRSISRTASKSISSSSSSPSSPSLSQSQSLSSIHKPIDLKSIGSISTLASRDSVLPEYEKLQNSLNKKVLSGRHPKSFKISSDYLLFNRELNG